MTYREKEQAAWEALPEGEREALEAMAKMAGTQEARELARSIAVQRYRRGRKARMNARSDRAARVLVGARIPREEAEQIYRCAQSENMSVYRFVREALREAL